MTDAAVSQMTVQVITQSPASSGLTFSVSQLAAQAIVKSSPRRVQLSQIEGQVLIRSTSYRVQIAQLAAQMLIQNQGDASGGGKFNVNQLEPQVVYTIGVPDTKRQKAWTFDFDGHTFYVLDLAERGAMVYDLTTQSWSQWDTAGYEGHLNFKNGFHWRDGKQVVGGGILDGLLVSLDEGSYIDEDFRPVTYEVNGVVFASSETYIRQFNLRLVGSPGRTGLVDPINPPILNMSFSDNNGATWSNPRAIELTSSPEQRIEFRSLGAFRQPGRIFKLYDNGGVKFIAYVMADVEGGEGGS
jgi:hypothetical protein